MIRLDSAYYPPILTANSGHLRVGGLHEVYWKEDGYPTGLPIVFYTGDPAGAFVGITRVVVILSAFAS